jgi:hypothetical protein
MERVPYAENETGDWGQNSKSMPIAITGRTSPPVVTRQRWAIITHYSLRLQQDNWDFHWGAVLEGFGSLLLYLVYRVADSASWGSIAALDDGLISSCNLIDVRMMQVYDCFLSTRMLLSYFWTMQIRCHYVCKRSRYVIVRASETKAG